MEYYSECYDRWKASDRSRVCTRKITDEGSLLSQNAAEACRSAAEMYRRHNKNANDHMERNFVIKLLFWLDEVGGGLILSLIHI